MISDRRGFGLTGALMGIAISAVVMWAIYAAIESSIVQESKAQGSMQARELAGELERVVRRARCGIVELDAPIPVTGTQWASNEPIKLDKGLDGRFLRLKAEDRYGRLKVDAISISPYFDQSQKTSAYVAMDGANATDFANATRIKAHLKVDVSANSAVAVAPLRIPVTLSLDSARANITDCEIDATSDNIDNICIALGGTWLTESGSCQLPCPAGMVLNDAGTCADSNSETYCLFNDFCGVDPKFKIQ